MSLDSTLHFFIQELPKATKEEIPRSIDREPYEGKGSAGKNTKIIFDWLKQHGYNPPLNRKYTVDHIKDFIIDIQNPYYPERRPEIDDEDELKQLEQMREAIDERIRELQEKEKQEQPIWEEEQQ